MNTKLNIHKLIAISKSLTYEHKVYNIICFITIILYAILIPLNFLINTTKINMIILFISGGYIFLFIVFCRWKNKIYKSAYLLLNILTLTILWFTNNGSMGSVPYFFPIILFISIIFFKNWKRWVFIFFNILTLFTLIMLEYINPNLIIDYSSRLNRYLDISTGIVLSFSILAWIMVSIVNSYDDEREKVKQKNIELENNNVLLNNKNKEIEEEHRKLIEALEKLRESEEKYKQLSTMDYLTNIYNRLKFTDYLTESISLYNRHGTKFSLIMFDIDDFKKINDTYGHDIGDKTLINLVKIISKVIRRTDIFARLGGDEFMIIARNTDLENTIKLAEKIIKEIEKTNFEDNQTINCSFGIAEFSKNDTIESFLIRIDKILYNAKSEGKNRISQ